MAAWRGVSAGGSGSFGRSQAILNWAHLNWEFFDGWCCAKGIDPIELPAYRFWNLALYCMKEDVTSEGLKSIDDNLALCDSIEHPFKSLFTKAPSKGTSKKVQRVEDKQNYIPPWWNGEQQSAAIALRTMKELPK